MRTILSTDCTSVFAAHRDARAIIPIPQLTHAIPRKHTKTRRFTTSPESFSRPPQTDGAFYACYLIPGIYPDTGTCPLRPILYFSTSFLDLSKCPETLARLWLHRLFFLFCPILQNHGGCLRHRHRNSSC